MHTKKTLGIMRLKPRLSVFRSNKHIYAQLIDDLSHKTIVSANDLKIKKENIKPVKIAEMVGIDIAKKAIKKKVKSILFDRSHYKFHGRVKALAEGARAGGLQF